MQEAELVGGRCDEKGGQEEDQKALRDSRAKIVALSVPHLLGTSMCSLCLYRHRPFLTFSCTRLTWHSYLVFHCMHAHLGVNAYITFRIQWATYTAVRLILGLLQNYGVCVYSCHAPSNPWILQGSSVQCGSVHRNIKSDIPMHLVHLTCTT